VLNNVEANLLACKAGDVAGEVFNIACGERFTLLDLIGEINTILDKHIEPRFEPARTGDVKHSLADISKAKKQLGYEVKVDFKEGLERTVEHIVSKIKDYPDKDADLLSANRDEIVHDFKGKRKKKAQRGKGTKAQSSE